MGFTLRFLGSGNAWSKPPINYNNNVLVETGDHCWLIDCGLLCPLALHNQNIELKNIDGVFVSHLHGDHVGGLEEIGFYRFFHKKQKKPQLWLSEAFHSENARRLREDIWENNLCSAMGNQEQRLTLEDYFDVHFLHPDREESIFGVPARIFPVRHVPGKSSFGICLDKRIYFTSDCTFSQKRIEDFCRDGAEAIFHDVTFMTPYPGAVHTAFEELAGLPRELSEKIILMHYEDSATEADFSKAVQLGFRIAKKNSIFAF